MSNGVNSWPLSRILLVSAIVGLIGLLLFLFALGFKFFGALLWGIIIGVITFLILWLNFGGEEEGSASYSGSSGAAGAGTSSGSSSASGSGNSDDASSTSPAASSGGSASVSKSASLPGEEELASRMGTWKYEGDASDASGSEGAADSSGGGASGSDGSAGDASGSGAESASASNASTDDTSGVDDAAGSVASDASSGGGGGSSSSEAATGTGATAGGSKDGASTGGSGGTGGGADSDAHSGNEPAGGSGGKGAGGSGEPADETQPNVYDTAPDDADNLKELKGVGPGLEKTLNGLGIYKFAQIAEWGDGEIAWVDARLKFKGRITRDDWVGQAKTLATGGETEFSKRVDKGGVY